MPDGSRHSHQHRIPRAVLTQGRDALMGREYKRIKTFAELHRMVAQAVGSIRGIGPLTVYDTAHRLGAYLRLSPEVVYLHAGTRLGAQALGLNWRAESLPMTDFPRAFQRLTPEQVEDCLCIYKAELSAWAQSRHRNA